MGSGIDAARGDAPEHAQMLDDMKDQLLIVLFNRLGGKVDIPATEINDTGQFLCSMSVSENGIFHFEVSKKS